MADTHIQTYRQICIHTDTHIQTYRQICIHTDTHTCVIACIRGAGLTEI